MGIYQDYNEAAERVGNGTAQFIEEATVQVRGFACGLWNLYPRFITETSFGGSQFIRGAMNYLCTPNVPPPPESPFTGGQCSGDRYLISTTYKYTLGADPTELSETVGLVGAPGILGAITSIEAVPPGGTGSSVITITFQDGTQTTTRIINAPSNGVIVLDSFTYDVSRADGQPDTCGNPPAEYPDVVVNINDFSDTLTFNALDGGTIDVDIEYLAGDVHYPMQFSFGGINVTLNFGGVYFNFGGVDSNGNPRPESNGDRLPLPVPRDNQGGEEFVTPERPPNTEEQTEEVQPELPSDSQEVDITLVWVILTITQTPVNVKTQSGDGAPDVFYCGWFEWLVDGRVMPRQPVHFLNNVFKKPAGATGYAYTLYNGFNGQAVQYIQKGG